MTKPNIIPALQNLLNADLPADLNGEAIIALLKVRINHLLQHNFQGLISLLYRIDISEEKLKYQLQLHRGEDAAAIIAQLMIDRLIEKAVSKQQFKNDADIAEEDKW